MPWTGLDADCCSALQVVILGIDPDASGAFTTLEWPAAAPRTEGGLPSSLADAALQLFDMPMETIALGTRSRRCARSPGTLLCTRHQRLRSTEVSCHHTSQLQRHGRLRRQADACMISELLNALLPPLAAKATVHCILEQPVPNALNGEAGSTALCVPVACCPTANSRKMQPQSPLLPWRRQIQLVPVGVRVWRLEWRAGKLLHAQAGAPLSGMQSKYLQSDTRSGRCVQLPFW